MQRSPIAATATGSGSPVDPAIALQQQDRISFYASAAGGRLAFNITTGVVSLAAGTGEVPLALLLNPAGSGKDLHLDIGEFGSSFNTTFRRYRNSTVSGLGTPNTASNTGGGSATSVAQMYVPGQYTRTGGQVSKTAHIAGYYQYIAQIKGRSILRPGQSLAWTITQVSGQNHTASIYFEYWELPAAT